jgi:hypothetical protein
LSAISIHTFAAAPLGSVPLTLAAGAGDADASELLPIVGDGAFESSLPQLAEAKQITKSSGTRMNPAAHELQQREEEAQRNNRQQRKVEEVAERVTRAIETVKLSMSDPPSYVRPQGARPAPACE